MLALVQVCQHWLYAKSFITHRTNRTDSVDLLAGILGNGLKQFVAAFLRLMPGYDARGIEGEHPAGASSNKATVKDDGGAVGTSVRSRCKDIPSNIRLAYGHNVYASL